MAPRFGLFTDVPSSLTLVRHGESVANIADARAHEARAEELMLDSRDADVPLSDNGRDQAAALRRWCGTLADDDRPTLVLSSPYRRAEQTAREVVGDLPVEFAVDERLRERDLGRFDGLTGHGIRERFPEEVERRDLLGKFYYQPPRGESWADVALRVRSLVADLRSGHGDARIWVFSHQAVIMVFRYVLEGLTEHEVLDIDRRMTIPNASITRYQRHDGRLELTCWADDSVVRDAAAREDVEPTSEPSAHDQEPG